MTPEEGPKYTVVKSSELGPNCWLPRRFIKGHRCERVRTCKYPEKAQCLAVEAEIEYLQQYVIEVQEDAIKKIQEVGLELIEFMKTKKG